MTLILTFDILNQLFNLIGISLTKTEIELILNIILIYNIEWSSQLNTVLNIIFAIAGRSITSQHHPSYDSRIELNDIPVKLQLKIRNQLDQIKSYSFIMWCNYLRDYVKNSINLPNYKNIDLRKTNSIKETPYRILMSFDNYVKDNNGKTELIKITYYKWSSATRQ